MGPRGVELNDNTHPVGTIADWLCTLLGPLPGTAVVVGLGLFQEPNNPLRRVHPTIQIIKIHDAIPTTRDSFSKSRHLLPRQRWRHVCFRHALSSPLHLKLRMRRQSYGQGRLGLRSTLQRILRAAGTLFTTHNHGPSWQREQHGHGQVDSPKRWGFGDDHGVG